MGRLTIHDASCIRRGLRVGAWVSASFSVVSCAERSFSRRLCYASALADVGGFYIASDIRVKQITDTVRRQNGRDGDDRRCRQADALREESDRV